MNKILFFDNWYDEPKCLNGCIGHNCLFEEGYDVSCEKVGQYNNRIDEYSCNMCNNIFYGIKTKYVGIRDSSPICILFSKDVLLNIDTYLHLLDIFINGYVAENKEQVKLNDILKENDYFLRNSFYQDIVFGFYESKNKEIACEVCKYRKYYNMHRFFDFNKPKGYAEIKCENCNANISLIYSKGDLMHHVQTLATKKGNGIIEKYLVGKCVDMILDGRVDLKYIFGELDV